MEFKLYIHTENEAFGQDGDERTRASEVARILNVVATRLYGGDPFAPYYETLFDSNGNDVGRAAFKLEEAK